MEVVNAQNYILGVSVAGFLMYPLLKRVYRKNNNMLLLHIFKVCVVITGIICIAVMGTHSSYVSIFISGCVFFAIMGIVGSAVHYSLAVNISNYSMPVILCDRNCHMHLECLYSLLLIYLNNNLRLESE